MITKEHYLEIAKKNGEFSSWAIWAEQGIKPKSNIGDISVFDLDLNPDGARHCVRARLRRVRKLIMQTITRRETRVNRGLCLGKRNK